MRSNEAQAALDYVLKQIETEFKDVPENEQMVTKISNRLKDTFSSPPVKEFELLLRKNFTEDEVIIALFHPKEEQYQYFPTLLLATTFPCVIPLANIKSLLLSLIFLVYRKQWSFMEQFIVHGGLHAISTMVNDENLYIRGQAIEVFLSVTDCDSFDWFQFVENFEQNTSTRKEIHLQLLSLVNNSSFLENLIANREKSYPGGSCRCLQILAFWLSWLRALYTTDQKLILSRKVLFELKLWSQAKSTFAEGVPEDVVEDELKLAATLYEDFGYTQFGNTVPSTSDVADAGDITAGTGIAESTGVSSVSGTYTITGIDHPSGTMASSTSVDNISGSNSSAVQASQEVSGGVSTVTPTAAVGIVSAEIESTSSVADIDAVAALKAEGNTLFKTSHYTDAIVKYERAVELLALINVASGSETRKDLHIDLLNNLATSYWKLSESQSDNHTQSSDDDNSSILTKCEEYCKLALSLAPFHTKALYRLISVYLLRGSATYALERVVKALNYYKTRNAWTVSDVNNTETTYEHEDNSSRVTEVEDYSSSIELLNSLRVRCIAAILNKSIGVAAAPPITTSATTATRSNNVSEKQQVKKDYVKPLSASDLNMSTKGLQILKSILNRNQIHCAAIQTADEAAAVDTVLEDDSVTDTAIDTATDNVCKDVNDGVNTVRINGAEKVKTSKAVTATITTVGAATSSTNKPKKTSSTAVSATATATVKKASKSTTDFTSNSSMEIRVPSTTALLKKAKDKSTAKAASVSAAVTKAFTLFKRQCVMFESKVAGENGPIYSQEAVRLLTEGITTLSAIWNEGATMNQLFTCSLEECHTLFLFHIVIYLSAREGVDVGETGQEAHNKIVEILTQLSKCDRYDMTVNLTLAGNDPLRTSLAAVLARVKGDSVVADMVIVDILLMKCG